MNRALLVVTGVCVLAASMIAQDGAVRVPEPEAKKSAITRVEPEYPPMAKQMRVMGRVQVDAYIGADGTVEKVQPLSGNMLLSTATVNAVKRWKFSPPMSGGRAVKAVATLTFDFKL